MNEEDILVASYALEYCHEENCVSPCAAEVNARHYLKTIKERVWDNCVEAHTFVRGRTVPANPYR